MKFLPMLCLLLIGLKLAGVIAWPWIWVLSPMWIPFAASLLIILGSLALAALVGLLPR